LVQKKNISRVEIISLVEIISNWKMIFVLEEFVMYFAPEVGVLY